MKFGYFDNHYENNTRSSNQFVADISAELAALVERAQLASKRLW